MLKMREVVFDKKYVSDRVLERSYGKLMVTEDGDDITTQGEWVLYLCAPGEPDDKREAWSIHGLRDVIADNFGLELINMEVE